MTWKVRKWIKTMRWITHWSEEKKNNSTIISGFSSIIYTKERVIVFIDRKRKKFTMSFMNQQVQNTARYVQRNVVLWEGIFSLSVTIAKANTDALDKRIPKPVKKNNRKQIYFRYVTHKFLLHGVWERHTYLDCRKCSQ